MDSPKGQFFPNNLIDWSFTHLRVANQRFFAGGAAIGTEISIDCKSSYPLSDPVTKGFNEDDENYIFPYFQACTITAIISRVILRWL